MALFDKALSHLRDKNLIELDSMRIDAMIIKATPSSKRQDGFDVALNEECQNEAIKLPRRIKAVVKVGNKSTLSVTIRTQKTVKLSTLPAQNRMAEALSVMRPRLLRSAPSQTTPTTAPPLGSIASAAEKTHGRAAPSPWLRRDRLAIYELPPSFALVLRG